MAASTGELEKFLGLLKEEQVKWAEAALARPADRTEFGYGRACGYFAGLHKAEELLSQILDDEEKKT